MRLDQARATSAGASELIDATTVELLAAIREVRDLARGVHPPILTDAGLGAAIEALAERTPFPVAIEATDARFAPEVEAAAYFVVAEGLTNIARYADATGATRRAPDRGRPARRARLGRRPRRRRSGRRVRACAAWPIGWRRSAGS